MRISDWSSDVCAYDLKHSAYILQHADMPGFSNDDQQLLALFALGHHGKLRKLPSLGATRSRRLTLLCPRLAVLLSRRRDRKSVVEGRSVSVRLALGGWRYHKKNKQRHGHDRNE